MYNIHSYICTIHTCKELILIWFIITHCIKYVIVSINAHAPNILHMYVHGYVHTFVFSFLQQHQQYHCSKQHNNAGKPIVYYINHNDGNK